MTNYDWCTFEAKGEQSVKIGQSFCAGCILFIIVLFFVWLIKKKNSQLPYSYIEKCLVIGVVSWVINLSLKTIVNVYAYEQYIKKPDGSVKQMTILSILFWFFEYIGTFVILGLLFVIPSSWLKEVFLRVDEKIIVFEERIHIHRIFMGLKMIKFYIIFRFLFVLFVLTVMIMGAFKHPLEANISRWTYYIIIFQVNFLIIFYFLGLISVWLFRRLLHFQKKAIKQLIFEYLCLMFVCLFRLLYNILVNALPSEKKSDCSKQQNDLNFALLLMAARLIMHVIPLSLMFKIYWPQNSPQKNTKQSLIS